MSEQPINITIKDDETVSINISEETLNFTNNEPVVIAPSVQAHLNNTDIHITNTERQIWNDKQDLIPEVNLIERFEGELA